MALTGCPDTSRSEGPDAGSVGRLKLVQTIVEADDPDVSAMGAFVGSPKDDKLYANFWTGRILTFNRSPVDGSLARAYATPLFNGSGLAITADGKHLYGVGSNKPDQLLRLDIDPAAGEPVPQLPSIHVRGSQLAIAAHGAWLYESSRDNANISAYHIDPVSGALTPGPKIPHESPVRDFAFLVDDEHGALFALSESPDARRITRYAVDPDTGALTKEAETFADLWGALTILALCPGTTRMYVPQQAGSIGYADISGNGLNIPASFSHPDLAHVRSAILSADCKNLYAITSQFPNGSLVVLARDEAGDLSWLQTIPTGPGTPVFALSDSWHALASLDGKNVYVGSSASGEGFAVFQRDTAGAAP